jgi:hypothetical protein
VNRDGALRGAERHRVNLCVACARVRLAGPERDDAMHAPSTNVVAMRVWP